MRARSKTTASADEIDLFVVQGLSPLTIAEDGPPVPTPSIKEPSPAPAQKKKSAFPRSKEDLRPGTAKVKLNVARLTDTELRQACTTHLVATRDNPLFDNLTPDQEDYETLINDFAKSVTHVENLKLTLLAAYQERDKKRAALEKGTRMRISGVQIATKGDPSGIAGAGFEKQKTPTATGTLIAPEGLVVTLEGAPGTLVLNWKPSKKNRGYLLQYAEGKEGDPSPDWTLVITTKPRYKFNQMTIGTSYLFRVATIGGKDGRSAWSPIVSRVAG